MKLMDVFYYIDDDDIQKAMVDSYFLQLLQQGIARSSAPPVTEWEIESEDYEETWVFICGSISLICDKEDRRRIIIAQLAVQ